MSLRGTQIHHHLGSPLCMWLGARSPCLQEAWISEASPGCSLAVACNAVGGARCVARQQSDCPMPSPFGQFAAREVHLLFAFGQRLDQHRTSSKQSLRLSGRPRCRAKACLGKRAGLLGTFKALLPASEVVSRLCTSVWRHSPARQRINVASLRGSGRGETCSSLEPALVP